MTGFKIGQVCPALADGTIRQAVRLLPNLCAEKVKDVGDEAMLDRS